MFIKSIVYYVFGIIGFTNGIIDSFNYINKNEYLEQYNKKNYKLFTYVTTGTLYSLTYLSIPFVSNRIIDYLIKSA